MAFLSVFLFPVCTGSSAVKTVCSLRAPNNGIGLARLWPHTNTGSTTISLTRSSGGGGRFWKVEAGNELRWELVTSFQNRSSSFCFHTTDISDFQTSALVSESPSRVFSRSDPVGPALLSAEPDQDHHGGSTGLRVLWSRSAGHVDWYEVTVEDSTTGVSRSTRVSGTATPQSGFSSLVPGTRYTVSVLASSGGKNATSVRTSAATGEKRYFFVIF